MCNNNSFQYNVICAVGITGGDLPYLWLFLPHGQCSSLVCYWYKERFLADAHWFVALHLHCAGCAHGILPCKGCGLTASRLDLPSQSPLSVVGWGLLQLGVAHWATSVALLHL